MFVWQHCHDPTKFDEILQMVEPYEEERKMIINCIKHNIVYQSYIAVDSSNFVVAIVIATILPKTQTLHIEDFALHPNIQKTGHARKLWHDWRDFINKMWTKVESLTIEIGRASCRERV